MGQVTASIERTARTASRRRLFRRVAIETALAVAGSTAACYLLYLALGLQFPPGGINGVVMLVAPIATPLVVAPFVALPFARSGERIARLLEEVDETRRQLAREVTERTAVQQRLEELVWCDPLTGLLNRRGFFNLTGARAARDLALFVLDVDDFKRVNDSWGHAAGDAVLRSIGSELSNAVPGCEVARLGGDEFAVIVDVAHAEALAQVAVHLAGVQVVLPDGSETTVSCSAGWAPLPSRGSVDSALAAADEAMYAAKRRRANALRLADEALG